MWSKRTGCRACLHACAMLTAVCCIHGGVAAPPGQKPSAKPSRGSALALPAVLRMAYLPNTSSSSDLVLSATLLRRLADAGFNAIGSEVFNVTPPDSLDGTSITLADAVSSASWPGNYPVWLATHVNLEGKEWPQQDMDSLLNQRADGYLINLSAPALETSGSLQADLATSPTITAWEQLLSLDVPPALRLGVIAPAIRLETFTTSPKELQHVILLAPDLLTLEDVLTTSGISTAEGWLRHLAEMHPRRRITPYIKVGSAAAPQELEQALQISIQTTGGVLLALPMAELGEEWWSAIRRGLEANYLLPEG